MGQYLYELTGDIRYNNENIQNLDVLALRKHYFGYVPQDASIINDTIRYNLFFTNTNVLDYALFSKLTDLLNMNKWVNYDTLDTVIYENTLSGGEKQKLAILKILYKNPVVMVFDEPTSALEDKTSDAFINYISSIKQDKIIIIITHDKKIKSHCDVIINI